MTNINRQPVRASRPNDADEPLEARLSPTWDRFETWQNVDAVESTVFAKPEAISFRRWPLN
jgi:hypothetical protein